MNPVVRDRKPELRRHPRAEVAWPVTVEAGDRLYHLETVNLSPFGAKVSLKEPLEVGSQAQLHFTPPEGRPLDVQAIVWRSDEDGPAFFFIGVRHSEEYSFPTSPQQPDHS
ncbi:MAG TPA: PilZ domain-containing protein [Methylomirabilota bacterium]|nr:PilZ domain-containing protein [Methylomirabilota bacterium]